MNRTKLKIAVIGGGVAGISAAYLLQRKHDVTLFEKNDYVGGHTNTIFIPDGPDSGTPVDTGFIVLNDRTYPLFNQLLKQLNAPIRKSDMSFGFYSEKTGLQYSSNLPDGLFAERLNLFRPAFWRLICDIIRFNKKAASDLEADSITGQTLGNYLGKNRFSSSFTNDYIVPMGAAIWSSKPNRLLEFPASTFIRFYKNHGLLSLSDRPQWYSVTGGSHSYVKSFLNSFGGKIKLNTAISSVKRHREQVAVTTKESERNFDAVVFAAHADETLKLLTDPSEEEKALLGAWRYEKNTAVLHTDETALPPNRRAWASWNYVQELSSDDNEPVSVTYDMNRLQGLKTKHRYFVSLNRKKPVAKSTIIREIIYTHPQYTFESVATQTELPKLNGARNTYFCGSYFGYGFHEDAVRSAVQVAKQFGIDL